MKFTIFSRLIISYLAIILLIICLGAYAILRLNHVNKIMDYVIAVDGATVKLTTELTDTLFTQMGFDEKYFLLKDRDFYIYFGQAEESFLKAVGKLEKMADTSHKIGLVKEIKDAYGLYVSQFRKDASLLVRNRNGGGHKIHQWNNEKLIDEIDQKLGVLAGIADSDREKKMKAANAISIQVTRVTTATVGIAILIVIFISVLITRSINNPIFLLKEKTKELAKGRYPDPLNINSPPEIRELTAAFDNMCERLRELDDMKIDFISHVSHKLRTPLTAIKEASSMLLEGIFRGAPAKQAELFSIIRDECERLIKEVNRILDLSRMEAKMMDYHFELSNIIPIIHKNVLKLTPLAHKKGIDFETNIDGELPFVRMDSERITQVVEELIGNALKFTAEGGKVTISAFADKKGRDRFSDGESEVSSDEKAMIEISVADTGCGIPAEELERVFDKFKRIERGRATERGTGLGLSIAKHVVTVHGGQIWAVSEQGEGSSFSFTLPVSS